MRLVTIDSREAGGRPGLLLASGEILDMAASPGGLAAAQWRPQSVVSILAQGAEGQAQVARLVAEYTEAAESQRAAWRTARRLLPASGTKLMPPIRRPGLLLMVNDGPQQRAGAYVKNPNSAVGPDAKVAMPAGEDPCLYMMGMIGLVLGRPLFRCSEAEALRALSAVTLVADLGTRALPRQGQQPARGADGYSEAETRQFPGACVLGPALVSLDELKEDWSLAIRVNGRPVATTSTALNANGAARLLTNLAKRYAFRPGDVVGVAAGIPEFEVPGGSSVVLSMPGDLALPFSTSD